MTGKKGSVEQIANMQSKRSFLNVKEKLRILYSQRTLRGSDGKKGRLYGENEAALGQ